METEIWPNVLRRGAARAALPMLLANARLSERSRRRGAARRCAAAAGVREPAPRRWRRPRPTRRACATPASPSVGVVGNLKFDLAPDPALLARGRALEGARLARPRRARGDHARRRGGDRCSPPGVRVAAPRPLLVVVPRHPQRFEAVAELIADAGFTLSRRSAWQRSAARRSGRVPTSGSATRCCEMPAWYALADVALLGGSFAPLGGQNLIEAAACGCPVVMGPHTFNFTDAAELALAAGAAIRVATIPEASPRALALRHGDERRGAAPRRWRSPPRIAARPSAAPRASSLRCEPGPWVRTEATARAAAPRASAAQQAQRPDRALLGEDLALEASRGDLQVVAEHALEHGAQVGRDALQVAAFEAARPSPGRASRRRRGRRWTAPPRTKATPPVPWSVPSVPLTATSRPNSLTTTTTVRCPGAARRPGRRAAPPGRRRAGAGRRRAAPFGFGLVGVRVPAADLEHRRLRPVRLGEELGGAARQGDEGAGAAPPAPSPPAPSSLHRPPACRRGAARPLERGRQRRVAGVHALQPATRSADGSGSTDGAQVSTSARPRSTSGTVVLSARPLLPLAASARPSQPVESSYGRVPPLSSTCWASKCERSR